MEIKEFRSDDGKSIVKGYIGLDTEYADPIALLRNVVIVSNMDMEKDLIRMKKPTMVEVLGDEYFKKRAEKIWTKRQDEIMNSELHENFMTLLLSKSKGDQIKLLKGMSLTPHALTKLTFMAYKFGYSYSVYHSERVHKGLEISELPEFIHIDKDVAKAFGPTTLTNGELKNVILHRKVVIAKFLDIGENWHCFYLTYKSLRGEESWKDGQPHYHYLSDKWGIPRGEVVKRFKDCDLPSSSVHIDLLDY